MNRSHIAIFCSLLVFIVAASNSDAQESTIRFRARPTGKETSLVGSVKEESISEVVFRPTNGIERKIPSVDIVDLSYPVPAVVSQEHRRARNNEEIAKWDVALKQYQDSLPQLTEPKSKRHTEFRIAYLMSKVAETDDKQVKPAIDHLQKFRKANPTSWEIVFIPRLLIPMMLRENDVDGAQKALAELEATPKLPAEVRLDCNSMLAKILVDSKKFAEAEKRLNDLIKNLPADDPQALRLKVSLAECLAANQKVAEATKELEGIINRSTNPDVRAVAYNALGDCYQQSGQARQAMWNYMFVHVIYHQNKEEHARALYSLHKVFKTMNDDKKAQQFRDTLVNDKQFAGRYQDMMLKEK